jgi:hypothetical protein
MGCSMKQGNKSKQEAIDYIVCLCEQYEDGVITWDEYVIVVTDAMLNVD